jgi:lysophospholipase L1-like esterase
MPTQKRLNFPSASNVFKNTSTDDYVFPDGKTMMAGGSYIDTGGVYEQLSTISGTESDPIAIAQKGVPGGIATLDLNGLPAQKVNTIINAANFFDTIPQVAGITYYSTFTGPLTSGQSVVNGEQYLLDPVTNLLNPQRTSNRSRIILNKSFFTDFSDFTVVGTPAIIGTNSEIVLQNNGGNWTNALKFYESNDEKVDIEVIFQVNSVGGSGYGFFIGWESTARFISGSSTIQIQTFGPVSDMKYWSDGQGTINYSANDINKRINGGIIAGRKYKLTLSRRGHKYTYILEDLISSAVTTLVVHSANQAGRSSYGAAKVYTGTGRYKIGSLSANGAISVLKIKVVSESSTNPYLICMGDSKTAGFNAGRTEERFGEILNTLGSTQIWAGAGDGLANAITNVPLVIARNPTYVLLCIGRNDVAGGQALATTQSQYTSLVASLTTAGIKVIHLISSPENASFDATMASFNSWIKSTYATTFIEAGISQGFKYSWIGDNIHFNSDGHRFIANYIINSGLIPKSLVNTNQRLQFNNNLSDNYYTDIKDNLGMIGYQIDNPANAGTTNINDGVLAIQIEPAAALTSLTINMPVNPIDQQLLHFNCNYALTGITMATIGTATIVSPLTSLSPGNAKCYKWYSSTLRWLPWSN